ncbi:MAG: lytic transglycosylase domain-containing protein [bacterium]|nr:lytic transglycosylase domain-containing protein [bacterium]
MNLSFLPGAILLIILFLNSENPTHISANKIDPEHYSHVNAARTSTAKVENDPDFKAIHYYITSTYKRINKEDAALISKYLVDYGKKHKLDPKFAAAVIARESGFNKKAISPTGAKGLGQIKKFNFKNLNISNPYDIKQNINGTIKYLKEKFAHWHNKAKKEELALASYYKGYTAVKRTNGKLDNKTENYVKDILNNYKVITGIRNRF